MRGQYHLQAPLGLNRGSSICLLEHIKDKKAGGKQPHKPVISLWPTSTATVHDGQSQTHVENVCGC